MKVHRSHNKRKDDGERISKGPQIRDTRKQVVYIKRQRDEEDFDDEQSFQIEKTTDENSRKKFRADIITTARKFDDLLLEQEKSSNNPETPPKEQQSSNFFGISNNVAARIDQLRRYFVNEIKFNFRYKHVENDRFDVAIGELTGEKSSPLHSFYLISILPVQIPEFIILRTENYKVTVSIVELCDIRLTDEELDEIIEICSFFDKIEKIDTWKEVMEQVRSEMPPPDTKHLLLYPRFVNLNTVSDISNSITYTQLRQLANFNIDYFKYDLNLNNFMQNYLLQTNYPNTSSLVKALQSSDEEAIKVAESLSTSINGKVVMTIYNHRVYVVQHISAFLTSSLMSNSEQTFQEYYSSKYALNFAEEAMVRVSFARPKKKPKSWEIEGISGVRWEMQRKEQSPNEDSTDEDEEMTKIHHGLYLVPSQCHITHLSPTIVFQIWVLGQVMQHVTTCLEHYHLLQELEQQINYTFKDKTLLRMAMSHIAYTTDSEIGMVHYERLEYLGDSVLDIVVSHYLFEKFKTASEGKMSNLRTRLVRNRFLAQLSRRMNLNRYLLYPKDLDMADEQSVMADLFESLIGAIYIDGDFHAAKIFIRKYLIDPMEKLILQYDPYFEAHQYHSFEIPLITDVPLTEEMQNTTKAVENAIGIQFNNKFLLLQALTHSSYNLNQPDFSFSDKELTYDYERIEFLGDSVLKFIVSVYLYMNFPQANEGDMTLTRHSTVDNDVSLVAAAEALGVMPYIRHKMESSSNSLKKGSVSYKKFMADIFEALIGAIYLDQGGFHMIKPREYDVFGQFIRKFLFTVRDCDPNTVQAHYKTALQELIQHTLEEPFLPKYIEQESEFYGDLWYYTCDVTLSDILLATGEGSTKKEAQADGARKALEVIKRITSKYDHRISLKQLRVDYKKISKNVPDLKTTHVLELKQSKVLNDFDNITVMSDQNNYDLEIQLRERIKKMMDVRTKL